MKGKVANDFEFTVQVPFSDPFNPEPDGVIKILQKFTLWWEINQSNLIG